MAAQNNIGRKNKMPKTKVLICGATGFIGRNVAEYLSKREDLEVYGTYFNSPRYEHEQIGLIRADLTDRLDVERVTKDKDIIIQMAANTSGAGKIKTIPHIHVTDNAVMNSLVLRAAFENEVKHFIFPSSSTVYPSSNTPLKETDRIDINSVYYGSANTKLYSEKMCKFFSRQGRTKHSVLRQSNIYGPHDKFDLERSHVFGATLTKVMKAKDGDSIKVWGTGEEKRDLLYISDLVKLIEEVIDRQDSTFELFNVGSGRYISIGKLVEKIIKHSGKKLKIEYDSSKPTIKTNLALDSTKARDFFNWSPKISLDEGIRKTMDWYKENAISD